MAAVRDLTLEVAHGEVVSLLGPSGCGKTTTLRLVAGFLEPDAGEIWVGERRLSESGYGVPPERRGMSMIFQSYAVWPHRTVAENVGYGLRFRAVRGATPARRVREALARVRLDAYADRYPGELSGGQQQRVALARALVVEPAILLLDEPLSNLDANLREEMRFEIRRLHEELRITTLYVTHDQAEAMVISDRIAVMRDGRDRADRAPPDIYERPRPRFVAGFVGRTNLLHGRRRRRGAPTGRAPALALRVADPGASRRAAPVAVSVRPHRIVLTPDDGAARAACASAAGTFFGATVAARRLLRRRPRRPGRAPRWRPQHCAWSTRPRPASPPGQRSTLAIPPEACVLLAPASALLRVSASFGLFPSFLDRSRLYQLRPCRRRLRLDRARPEGQQRRRVEVERVRPGRALDDQEEGPVREPRHAHDLHGARLALGRRRPRLGHQRACRVQEPG